MIEAVLTTKVTLLNTLISIAGTSLVSLASYFYLPKLYNALKEEIQKNLGLVVEDCSNQPLYSIFYKYNHPSTQAWNNWISSQDESSKEIAFNMLSSYLEQPLKKHGLITIEATKAISQFENQESFTIITQLIHKIRKHWRQYKALSLFHCMATKCLVELNPKEAQKTLTNEMETIKKTEDADEMKISIIYALSEHEEEIDLNSFWVDIVADNSHSLNVRKCVIELIQEKEGTEKSTLYQEILSKFLLIEEKEFIEQDYKVFKQLLESSYQDIADSNLTTWQLILKAYQKKKLQLHVIKYLCRLIPDNDTPFSQSQLLDLLKIETNVNKPFTNSLAIRFNVSETEYSVISEPEVRENDLIPNAIVNEKFKKEIVLPEALDSAYKRVEKLILNKTNTETNFLSLLTGNSESEKLNLVKAYASIERKNLILINSAKLSQSPSQINKLPQIIQNLKPCLVYFQDIRHIFKHDIKEEKKDSLNHKLIEHITNFCQYQLVSTVASIPLPKKHFNSLDKSFKYALEKFQETGVVKTEEFTKYNKEKRREMYHSYISKLEVDREVDKIDFDKVYEATKDLSSADYVSQLINYIKTSLLTLGKMMPFDEYLKLGI